MIEKGVNSDQYVEFKKKFNCKKNKLGHISWLCLIYNNVMITLVTDSNSYMSALLYTIPNYQLSTIRSNVKHA